jgi:Protein of unknown function (DUF4232)
MRRLTTVLLTAVPLAVLLAGCSSGDKTSAAPTPSVPTASTPAADATESTGDAPATTPPTSAGNGTGAAVSSRCHTSELKVTVAADEGGGAAGSNYESLVFTNAGKRTCTIYGYPGVSYVAGDQGTQINDPFQRTAASNKKTISLKPGAAGHATIGIPNYQNYPAADCKASDIRGFRVYPPDETASVFVSQPMKACTVKGKGVGLVYPIVAGGGAGPIK